MGPITALNMMADAMTAVNAGRWQVAGVEQWRGLISAEQGLAYDAGQPPGRITPDRRARPGRHDGWMHYAGLIVSEMSYRAAWAQQKATVARERAAGLDAAAGELMMSAGLLDPAAAAEAAARTATLRVQAEDLREKAARYESWAATASECASFGTQLTRTADDVHVPAGIAYAAAGRRWAPARKEFLGA